MSWLRWWTGTVNDPKWRIIASRAKCRAGDCVAVWAYLLEIAKDGDGNIAQSDCEECAVILGYDIETVEAIIAAMRDKSLIEGDRVASWDKRQPKREDDSKARVAAFRERAKVGNGAVTQCNAPETEAETDTDITAATSAGAQTLDGLESQLREAAKAEQNPSPSLMDLSPIRRCLTAGASLDMDVIPTIRAITARNHRWSSWRYAESAIMDAKARREAPAVEGQPASIRAKPPPDRPLRGSSAVSAALDRIFPDGQQASP